MNRILLLIFSLLLSTSFFAQISKLSPPKLSPFQKTEIKIGVVDVSLEYSRPSMRGREIFGVLEPYDKIWRTGANKNTKIVFSNYVVIGDTDVAPGTYTIFTKPSIDTWDVYFHSEIDEYGVPEIFDPQNSVVQVSIPRVKLINKVETLSITFDNLTANSANLTIAWETSQVSVLIKIPTDTILENHLFQQRVSFSKELRVAAYIYFDKEKNSKKALLVINESLKIIENGMPFDLWLENANLQDRRLAHGYYMKSLILEDLGKKDEAIGAAKKSLLIAKKTKSDWYIKSNTERIEKWKKNK